MHAHDGLRAMDAFEFVRLRREASGTLPLASLDRFCAGLPEQPAGEAGQLNWSLRGRQGERGEPLLDLSVQARPVVVCQRCLAPFEWPVDARVALHLVRSEEELDDADLAPDEDELDEPEKVLGSERFDLLAQIEDELILSVPYIPRHDTCPGQAGAPRQADDAPAERPSPFAVLEQLKSKK